MEAIIWVFMRVFSIFVSYWWSFCDSLLVFVFSCEFICAETVLCGWVVGLL